jgi:hypothetical protein
LRERLAIRFVFNRAEPRAFRRGGGYEAFNGRPFDGSSVEPLAIRPSALDVA